MVVAHGDVLIAIVAVAALMLVVVDVDAGQSRLMMSAGCDARRTSINGSGCDGSCNDGGRIAGQLVHVVVVVVVVVVVSGGCGGGGSGGGSGGRGARRHRIGHGRSESVQAHVDAQSDRSQDVGDAVRARPVRHGCGGGGGGSSGGGGGSSVAVGRCG